MKFRMIVLVAMIVATAFILDYGFGWLDRPSELAYTGGLLLLATWFVVVVPVVWLKLYKRTQK